MNLLSYVFTKKISTSLGHRWRISSFSVHTIFNVTYEIVYIGTISQVGRLWVRVIVGNILLSLLGPFIWSSKARRLEGFSCLSSLYEFRLVLLNSGFGGLIRIQVSRLFGLEIYRS